MAGTEESQYRPFAFSGRSIRPCSDDNRTGISDNANEGQQDFDALNSVVIAQQADIQAMRAILGRFEARLDTLSDPEPPRDPVAEQPPHY
jgi:uncharacterized coiled-coil protein SlyX